MASLTPRALPSLAEFEFQPSTPLALTPFHWGLVRHTLNSVILLLSFSFNFFFSCLIICLCCFLLVLIRILNINLSFLSKFLCFNSKLTYGFTNHFWPWV